MYHFFIYLCISWISRVAALLFSYQPTARSTSKDDVSASAVYYLLRVIFSLLVYWQVFFSFSCYSGGLQGEVGCIIYLFIYLFVCWSNRMTSLLLCYHSTALCTFKGDISASAICYLWIFFLVDYYIGRPSQASLAASVFLWPSFLSALLAATCFQPTTRRQLTVGMSILSYALRYSFRSLRITFLVERDHLYLIWE